jgi:hypothetical protein
MTPPEPFKQTRQTPRRGLHPMGTGMTCLQPGLNTSSIAPLVFFSKSARSHKAKVKDKTRVLKAV